jgi:hypothetical protein
LSPECLTSGTSVFQWQTRVNTPPYSTALNGRASYPVFVGPGTGGFRQVRPVLFTYMHFNFYSADFPPQLFCPCRRRRCGVCHAHGVALFSSRLINVYNLLCRTNRLLVTLT